MHCPRPAHDEHKSHHPDEWRHDHRKNGEVRKKISSRKLIAQKEECNGDPDDRSGDHVSHAEEKGIDQTFQVIGIRKKVVEVLQGEDTQVGRKGVVEEADEGIDEKDTEEGPDPGVAEQTADL